jgi:hypothetical protein
MNKLLLLPASVLAISFAPITLGLAPSSSAAHGVPERGPASADPVDHRTDLDQILRRVADYNLIAGWPQGMAGISAGSPQPGQAAKPALRTGQTWAVGQPMPVGYEVYNLPYAQRARYADDAERLYRYSDGYVYEIEAATHRVRSVIQPLA